jgi:hypothetical protein
MHCLTVSIAIAHPVVAEFGVARWADGIGLIFRHGSRHPVASWAIPIGRTQCMFPSDWALIHMHKISCPVIGKIRLVVANLFPFFQKITAGLNVLHDCMNTMASFFYNQYHIYLPWKIVVSVANSVLVCVATIKFLITVWDHLCFSSFLCRALCIRNVFRKFCCYRG